MSPIREALTEIENCIQMGHFSKAKKQMLSIALEEIPRSELLRASNLSRRCGMIHRSLKILGPLVLKQVHRDDPATNGEKADYAFSLNRIGLYQEAENLLEPLRKRNHAGAFFFSSLVHFTRWDYAPAYAFLKEFIGRQEVPEYRRMVGLSNLVSACIYLKKFEEAQRYLDQVLDYAFSEERKLLINLGTEQQAEIFVLTGRFDRASDLLARASKQSKDSGHLLNLWIAKWQAVMTAKSVQDSRGKEALERVFLQARSQEEWETCRDVHYHFVSNYQDQNLFNRVYFGTPFGSFKQRLEELPLYNLPEEFSFHIGPKEMNSTLIDFSQKKVRKKASSQSVKLTEAEWSLLASLASDSYKPIKVGELFGEIIKDEYYDPFTSPNRIHQCVFRFNEKVESADLGFKVLGSASGYRLFAEKPVRLIVPQEVKVLSFDDQRLLLLSKKLRHEEAFKASEAKTILEMSERSTNRWLKEKVENKDLVRSGLGKNTRYHFPAYKKVG